MGAAAVFLDRDGVINQEFDYVHTIDDFKFIENVIPAMKMIKDKGYALIIVTNQSGIARGLYSEEDFFKLTEWMDWSLQLEGIRLDGIYYCPHHPTEGVGKYRCKCDCRKPAPGMFYEARDYRSLDLAKCYMVGDRTSDIESGINAGIKHNYLVRTGYPLEETGIQMASGVFDNLLDFAKSLPVLPECDRPKKLKPRQPGNSEQVANGSEQNKTSIQNKLAKGMISSPSASRKTTDDIEKKSILTEEEFEEISQAPNSKIFMDVDEDWHFPEATSQEKRKSKSGYKHFKKQKNVKGRRYEGTSAGFSPLKKKKDD